MAGQEVLAYGIILARDSPPAPYDTIAGLGILSPADAQNKLATAKRVFQRHREDLIGTPVSDPARSKWSLLTMLGISI